MQDNENPNSGENLDDVLPIERLEASESIPRDEFSPYEGEHDGSIVKVMRDAYVDYAVSVITARALPDVRDGLKPVHRRILYTMYEEKITPDKPFRKSAATVGNVLARYHPHGDASVYDAMVRLAQPFNMRYPLIWPQGNFGSVDGDQAAHMRYTEAKLHYLGVEMLKELRFKTVDMQDNFDASCKEPVVLPAAIPNLLVNGSEGIAVGMATKVPPHNLGEVIDGCLAYVKNPDITVDELMEYIPGPDFPTGATILGQVGIRQVYATGRGPIRVRSNWELEGRSIVVTEIPFQVNKARLAEQIAQGVNDKRFEGISNVSDESSRKGMRLVIDLAKGASADVVMNTLFKYTALESTYNAVMLAILPDKVSGKPRHICFTLKEMIGCFIDHRRDVITRQTQYELDKAEARNHLVEGLLKALDIIDEIVALIRASRTVADAKASLMARFDFTEAQAQCILDMTLKKLTGMERQTLDNEHVALVKEIARCRELLSDAIKMNEEICRRLREIRDHKMADARRTQIIQFDDGQEIRTLDMIPDEPTLVTLSNTGYIKRMKLEEFRTQKRSGRGLKGAELRDDDILDKFYATRTHSWLLILTNKARAFRLPVYRLIESKRTAKGTPMVNLLPFENDEKPASIIPITKDFTVGSIFTITKKGFVKRTALTEYINIRKNGIRALRLDDDDELVAAFHSWTDVTGMQADEFDDEQLETADNIGEELEDNIDTLDADNAELSDSNVFREPTDLLIVTRQGRLLRFNESKVRLMGRVARGVKGIKLRHGDSVLAMDCAAAGSRFFVISERGLGKTIDPANFSQHGRNTGGQICYRPNDKTGELVAAAMVSDGDEIMISTLSGVVMRTSLEQVRNMGNYATGVKMIALDDDNLVSDITRIEPSLLEIEEIARAEVVSIADSEGSIDDSKVDVEEVTESFDSLYDEDSSEEEDEEDDYDNLAAADRHLDDEEDL